MNVLVYFLFSHFLKKKKQFDLVLQFSFLLFCYQRSFLELLCEQCTHIQLNKKTNNNRPAAFYILIIVIPQCCSSSLHREFVLFGTLRVKLKKRQKENQRLQKKSHYQQSSGRKPDVTVMAELKTKLTHTTQGKSLPMINIIRAFQLKQNMHIVQTMIRLVGILSKVLLCSYLQCVNPH